MKILSKIDDVLLTLKGVLLFFLAFRANPNKSKKQLEDYQFKKLKSLLIEASINVPYYRDLFKKIDFNPLSDYNSLTDIKKIPILKKDIVKSNPELFYNEKFKPSQYLIFKTSGSTGMPLEVRISKKAWIVEQAVVWRHWSWANYFFRDKMAIVRSYVGSADKLYKREALRNFEFYSPFHINTENGILYVKRMIDTKVSILRGYPSSIKSLALIVLDKKLEVPKLKCVLVASERLSEADRLIIEKAFNTKVFNHYGLADVCVMMGDCEKHEGLHNYQDYGYLELLDAEGYDDNIKRIVGTHIHNKAMPLIRYETGDLAETIEKDCSCDRNFPIIKNIIGRNDSTIKTVEGFEIPTVNFYTMFEYLLEIKKWQIVQESFNSININVLVEKKTEVLEKKIIDGFKLRLPDSITIKMNWDGNLETKGEGKIPVFISKI